LPQRSGSHLGVLDLGEAQQAAGKAPEFRLVLVQWYFTLLNQGNFLWETYFAVQ
jgi:hypothetical protein